MMEMFLMTFTTQTYITKWHSFSTVAWREKYSPKWHYLRDELSRLQVFKHYVFVYNRVDPNYTNWEVAKSYIRLQVLLG